jgi:hypothetical protein
LLDVPRKYAIHLVHWLALFPGELAKMPTRSGTHAHRPYGRAWARLKALARAFEGGRRLAILRTASMQGAPDAGSPSRPGGPGRFRGRARGSTKVRTAP